MGIRNAFEVEGDAKVRLEDGKVVRVIPVVQ
jgi:hypothetical protein